MSTTQPNPLGLISRSIHTTRRIQEIEDAIRRHQHAKMDVPPAWWQERSDLLVWLAQNRQQWVGVVSMDETIGLGEAIR